MKERFVLLTTLATFTFLCSSTAFAKPSVEEDLSAVSGVLDPACEYDLSFESDLEFDSDTYQVAATSKLTRERASDGERGVKTLHFHLNFATYSTFIQTMIRVGAFDDETLGTTLFEDAFEDGNRRTGTLRLSISLTEGTAPSLTLTNELVSNTGISLDPFSLTTTCSQDDIKKNKRQIRRIKKKIR